MCDDEVTDLNSCTTEQKASSWSMLSCLHIEIPYNSLLLVHDDAYFLYPLLYVSLSLSLPAALPITPRYVSPTSYMSPSVLSFLHPSIHVPANLSIMSTVYSFFPTSNIPSFSLSICSLHPHLHPSLFASRPSC